MQLRPLSFTLDGEAVCSPDRIAIFDALHRRGTVCGAMLYAFDLSSTADLGALSLGDRKKRLARLLGKGRLGIGLCRDCLCPAPGRPRSDPASQCGKKYNNNRQPTHKRWAAIPGPMSPCPCTRSRD
jgi:hypothetical protein